MNLNADKMKVFGDTELLCCPKCQKLVNMKILKASSALGVFGVSMLEYQVELFTICPECGSVFAVDKNVSKIAGKEKSNKYNCITEAHLKYHTGIKING